MLAEGGSAAKMGAAIVEAMKNPVLWAFLAAFLGGTIAAGIGWWSAHSLARTERTRDRLHEQLTSLYGPVYYYVMQNKRLFELSRRFHEAYKIEYIDKEWSQTEQTQQALRGYTSTTIDLENSYVHEVVSNNGNIKGVLDKHFGLCDPQDIEVFGLFYEHYMRHKTELDETGKLKTPMEIYRRIGDISFMRPEFIQRIEERCQAKQAEYLKLTS